MRSTRFVSLLVVAVLGLLTAVQLAGCASQPAAYTAASTPLADNLMNDFDKYTLAETAADVQSENTTLSTAFRSAISAGNAKVASAKWFGTGNIRSRLLNYWSSDPKFSTPGGLELQQIKVHNVEALDYILSVGDTQQTPK